MNIYQRINEIRKAVAYIQKDKQVSAGGGGNYKAVTHDNVTAKTRQAFIDNGVVIVPRQQKGKLDDAAMRWNDKAQMMTPAAMRLYRAAYEIDFVNADEPSDRLTVHIEAHAADNGDKAPGKAISYATKYAILKLLNLETGDDEESRHQERPIELITADQIKELTDLKEKLPDNSAAKFTGWLESKGVTDFAEIQAGAYPSILNTLQKSVAKNNENN